MQIFIRIENYVNNGSESGAEFVAGMKMRRDVGKENLFLDYFPYSSRLLLKAEKRRHHCLVVHLRDTHAYEKKIKLNFKKTTPRKCN